ncbi:MAG: tryptophan 7-halogenase [Sphingomonas sp.]|nr:tryptophan 7-halogenase [Sphingomonas sp.]
MDSVVADNRIRNVVIVGGGTAGWMAATALSRAFDHQLDIRLVESDEIGIVGVGEATIPSIRLFNALAGIDEDAFVRATQGTFKLGIEFQGWGAPGERYMHAFGQVGQGLGMLEFFQYWLRARSEGLAGPLWDYSFNATAAWDGRFARLPRIPDTKLEGLTHAFHFDASLYASHLRGIAEGNGVTRIEGKIVSVERRPEDGFVQSVTLDDGRAVDGELFIDCSGFRGLLIEQTLGAGFEDWSEWLPCDRAVTVASENAGPPRPYTQSIAHDAGWQWRIPLQHRTGNGHVFCSDYISEGEATSVLLANLEGAPLAEPRVLRFTAGMRRKFWDRNVVALGLASGFLEPLESTSIHLIQSGIAKLIALFPHAGFAPATTAEYNRQAGFEYERIRDFIILHYFANQRVGQPFWDRCRAMAIPDTLRERLELFRATGRVFREHEELFIEIGWYQVLTGQNIVPEAWHPLADALTSDELVGFLADLKTIVSTTAAKLPTHEQFISARCAAAPIETQRKTA